MSDISSRKDDHIRINLEQDVDSSLSTGFDRIGFKHTALPEFDFQDLGVDCVFFGKPLRAPILISSMTGGTSKGDEINQNLASAAQKVGIAMGVGSQRNQVGSGLGSQKNDLRNLAPDILLFANLGAVQLNYGFGLDECQKAIDILEADGLILHLNPLQEVLQPEGQTNFKGLLNKIEHICQQINQPVIVKEVGWGISAEVAIKLVNCGVAAIDVAGAGGTSWSEVEKFRHTDESLYRIASRFNDWGIPTAKAIQDVHQALPDTPVIASGGLRSGLDLAKSIALGASLGGYAGRLLKAATVSGEEVVKLLDEIILEMKVAMFAAGASNLMELQKIVLVGRSDADFR